MTVRDAPPSRSVLRGRVVTPDRMIEDGIVVVEADRIVEVRPAEPGDPSGREGATYLPGLVDLHVHGGGGGSFTTADPASVAVAVEHHRRLGTTSVVATLVSDAPDRMRAAVRVLAEAAGRGDLAAINAEGPFLSHARRGAHAPEYLLAPDLELARALVDDAAGHLRVMTLAPELSGAAALTAMLEGDGVVVGFGHTDADALTMEMAMTRARRPLVTHLFNAMAPWHHREPGAVAGALAASAAGEAVVELVGDGEHLADPTVRAVFALLGPTRIALVTDAIAAAGLPDGDYELGPSRVTLRDGVARLAEDDAVIAGGAVNLLAVVRRTVEEAGVPLVDAVHAASTTPAAVIRREDDLGALAPGRYADVVEVGTDLYLRRVMYRGAWLP